MRVERRVLVGVVALLALLGGCGEEGESVDSTTPVTSDEGTSTTSGDAPTDFQDIQPAVI